MSEFPLPRILEFVRTVVPFDTLSREELLQVVAHMEVAYYPRGEHIIRRGDEPARFLYLIQVGSARITLTDETEKKLLVDIRGEGDAFGAPSALQGTQALFDVTADEDLVVFLLPVEHFRELVDRYPAFQRHFSFSLARNIKAALRSAEHQLPQTAGTNAFHLDTLLMTRKVADLMKREVLACAPTTSIREAARLMTERRAGSIVVENETGLLIGVLTDADLRAKVLAQGRSLDDPVAAVMTRSLFTIKPEAYAFDALLDMSRHGVSHLPVTDDGHLLGMISARDLQMETGSSPVGLVKDIEKTRSVIELILLHEKIDRVLEMLLRQAGEPQKMVELVTELNDRVTSKLLKLVEKDLEDEGLGRPPVPFCWMALGSEGRREQTLRTDQDNGLVFSDVPQDEVGEVRSWFLTFSERVVEGLVRYGFPRCPGGIMASNPKWCQSESQWLKTFLDWVEDPSPLALRMASIFFDFRAIYDGSDFLNTLRRRIDEAVRRKPLFLRFLAKNSLYNRPPLGFLRQFVVETSGEHKNELNLKLRGLTPVVDSARIVALDLQIDTTNTFERLAAINGRGILDDELTADVQEAYGYVMLLRIDRHLEARAAGEAPENFVDPATLNNLQRKMLKESFSVIHRLQELIQFRYQTQFIVET